MQTNRRQFLSTTLAAAPLFIPATAFGANDRIAYGLIGTGNRGGGLNQLFKKAGAQCVALCDVYQPYLDKEARLTPGAKLFRRHDELLAHPGIDFVVAATPDHHHAPMLYDALAAKKDIYLEKPLSMTLEQSREMVAAVRKANQVVGIGMQRRSMEFIYQARKMIVEGALGKVSMAKAAWNWSFELPLDNSPLPGELDWSRFLGSAPQRPLEPRRFRWWRGFWDYCGGNMTDQGTHLMDVVQWLTGAGVPQSAVCQGRVINATGAEVPNVFSAVFDYPDMVATWTLDYRTTYDFDWSILLIGEEATMLLDRKGLRMYRNGKASPAPWSEKVSTEPVRELPETGPSEAHQKNFIDCVRSRKEPNCPIEVAAAAVTGPHMANLALRQERKIKLGPDGLPI